MPASTPTFTLHQSDELRAVEQDSTASLPAGTLMQRAGSAAAEWIAAQGAKRVRIVCGPGNNGGDGYVCASELKRRGIDAACVALAAPATKDAQAAAANWRDRGGALLTQVEHAADADLLVDAMFGIGLARPLQGKYLAAARWLNHQSRSVVALDVPSGLNADTGAWIKGDAVKGDAVAGDAVERNDFKAGAEEASEGVRADATLTFIADKPGLHTGDGCDGAGKVVVFDLGLSLTGSALRLTAPADFAPILNPRWRNSHKGAFGDVLVIGGGHGMIGAPVLAARAALRLGAGRVFVHLVGAAQIQLDPAQPELMFRTSTDIPIARVQVVGCGLGTGAAAAEALERALALADQAGTRLVLDADALNLLSARTPAWRASTSLAANGAVLTPHPLEAARLLGIDAASVQRDRVGAAQRLSAATLCIVVLKGAGTVIAIPGGGTWINPTGGPALASAGTGDVLAGMIGALLAQSEDTTAAVLAAVWLHGAAADEHGADVGLVASEIAPLAAARLGSLRQQGRRTPRPHLDSNR